MARDNSLSPLNLVDTTVEDNPPTSRILQYAHACTETDMSEPRTVVPLHPSTSDPLGSSYDELSRPPTQNPVSEPEEQWGASAYPAAVRTELRTAVWTPATACSIEVPSYQPGTSDRTSSIRGRITSIGQPRARPQESIRQPQLRVAQVSSRWEEVEWEQCREAAELSEEDALI